MKALIVYMVKGEIKNHVYSNFVDATMFLNVEDIKEQIGEEDITILNIVNLNM